MLALLAGLALGAALGLDHGKTPARAATPGTLRIAPQSYPRWLQALTTQSPAPGSRGAATLALQRMLFSLGHELALDGTFGAGTARELAAFQKAHGLKATGKAGRDTVSRLIQVSWWYPIRSGDTLTQVAALYGTTTTVLMRLNGLTSSRIQVGQRLLVPRAGFGGTVAEWGQYVVQPGDTLWSVAKRFRVPYQDMQRANALLDPRQLKVGERLWLPAAGRQTTSAHDAAEALSWPVRGSVTSRFGWRPSPFGGGREFHEGVDIAVPVGTPVRAAGSGVVLQAGWMGGFGYGVVIDHGEGMQTLYGHNRRLAVKVGDRVRRGQVVAWSGSTGRSTGPHVDFRIRVKGKTVDPLSLLPSR